MNIITNVPNTYEQAIKEYSNEWKLAIIYIVIKYIIIIISLFVCIYIYKFFIILNVWGMLSNVH